MSLSYSKKFEYHKARDQIEASGGGELALPGLMDPNSKEMWSLDTMQSANEVPTSDQLAPTDNAESAQEPSVSVTGDAGLLTI